MKYLSKLWIVILFVLSSAIVVQAQEKFKIIGLIVDEENTPVPFGNVGVFTKSDSSLVAGAASNEQGNFELAVVPGDYYTRITYVSYQPQFIPVTVRNRDVNLGVIKMEANTDVLDEVVVEGEKSQMELKLDKRVFNVSNDITNASRNAADILDNIPSVVVDVEGNVSLRGSQSVRILIDGKPSGLVGISGTDALRQLQGNIIERIEVITNPSAKYEAEGSAGVINIVLKKDRKKGFNGAFSGNIGVPTELGISGNVNYRKGRFNIFGNYGIEYDKRPGEGNSEQIFFPETDSTYTTIRDRDHQRGGISHTFRMGTDFSITDNDIITAAGLIRLSDEENKATIRYDDFNGSGDLTQRSIREDNEGEDEENHEYQLSYKRLLPGKGHEFKLDLQFRDGLEVESSDIVETYPLDNSREDLLQRSVNEEGDANFLIQADYTYPIKEGKKFEAGYRGNVRQITSDYIVEEQNEQGEWVSLENFSNRFVYDENVQAAYAIFENDMDKWGYQFGLRTEYTYISTFQRETDEKNERDYLNLFPSMFLSYKLNKAYTLQASYSRRISRPRFWYLNPFFSFSDRRNIRTGNPYLNPEFTDSYEFGLLNNLENSTFYAGVYYRHTTGLHQRVSYGEVLPGDSIVTTFSMPLNLGKEDAFGLEANFTYDPAEWLSMNGNANFYRSIIIGEFEGESLDRDTYTYNFQMAAKVKVGELDFQLRGNYRGPEITTQGERKSIYWMDLGANYKIMDGRGIFNFNIRDLFNSRRYRGFTETDVYRETSEFQWRARQFSLTFTYLINRKPGRNGRNGGDYDGGDMGM